MNYEEMSKKTLRVSKELADEYKTLCQKNAWLKRRGIPFVDDPCLEYDSPYSIVEFQELDALKAFFEHGNWAIRQGVLYHDLIFANQVDGGDEWWACKRFDGEWVPFESITFRLIINAGNFEQFMARLDAATREQCEKLSY